GPSPPPRRRENGGRIRRRVARAEAVRGRGPLVLGGDTPGSGRRGRAQQPRHRPRIGRRPRAGRCGIRGGGDPRSRPPVRGEPGARASRCGTRPACQRATRPAMSAAVAVPDSRRRRDLGAFVGRTFLHPAFDYLVIGGGLSLVVVAVLVWGGPTLAAAAVLPMPVFLMTTNLAHFASSTVRLYTKPGACQALPFVTMGLPLAALLVLSLAIAFADSLGPHLQNLYLTWSPYHYAAQAYGLSVMYSYRSGAALPDADKGLVRAACLAPFLFAFFKGPSAGVEWFAPASVLSLPAVAAGRNV